MLNYIKYLQEFLQSPQNAVFFVLILAFCIMQGIGEFLEFKGKVVPEFLKIRKWFQRKKKEREANRKLPEMLKNVEILLNNVEQHYSNDNITKRNQWIDWVNHQAKVYDNAIAELKKGMDKNNDITLSLLIDSKRDYLLDFTSKAVDLSYPLSKEQYNRFFTVHKEYEDIIEQNNMVNGQVDVAYEVVSKSFEERLKKHAFIEDTHGYNS